MAPIKRFEAGHLDLPGFWGPPSSSIDWCERNYVVTFYVAEFWNTISNVWMAVSSIIAFIVARRLGLQARWQVHGLAWAVVGTGSACFHGTLWYSGQLLDEVPMIYAALVWIYCCLQIYDESRARVIRWSFGLYAVVVTVVHAQFAFTTLFQVQYAMLILGGIGLTERGLRRHTGQSILSFLSVNPEQRRPGPRMLVRLVRWHVAWLAIAFVCWIADQIACEHWHNLPMNPQLHAWWHTLVAMSVYLGFQYSMSARLAELRGKMDKVQWVWYFYYFPIASDVELSQTD